MKISIVKEKGYSFDEGICTQTTAFIGRKRTGKSYAAVVLFEKIHSIGGHQIVFDPVGNWKAVTLDRTGKKPGLPITVFGGPKGHLPLPVDSGRVIGRMLMEKRISAVLDVSRFGDEDRERFVGDCVQAIYEVAQDEHHVCTLYFEEAQFFIPEGMGIKSKMFKKIRDAVRVGGNYGLGVVMITQRPQSVNKEILNQVELLFVGQLNGKHERDAIEGWIVSQGVDLKEELKQLPSFQRGEFFMWSPSWLETFAKVHIRRKETFDGSATPTLGAKVRTMQIAPVDVEALQAAIQDTIKTYSENDPAALKREVARLRTELAKQKPAEPELDVSAIEYLIGTVRDSEKATQGAWEAIRRFSKASPRHMPLRSPARAPAPVTPKAVKVTIQPPLPRNEGQPPGFGEPKRARSSKTESSTTGNSLNKCMHAILSVLKTHAREMSLKEISILTGYKITSGAFAQSVANLIKLNYAERNNKKLSITSDGDEVVGEVAKLPTGFDLLQYWKGQLSSAHGSILQVIFDRREEVTTVEEIIETTGYSRTSGAFAQALADIKKLQLVNAVGRGQFTIAESFL
jgi:hypothetical protein